MNLAKAFAETAQSNLKKTAVFWGDDEINYEQLLTQAIWMSDRLKSAGLKPGDRVAIWLKNCPQFIPALFGVLQAGAVVAPINNFLKADEVGYILSDADINVVITDTTMAEGSAKLAAARPGLQFVQVEEIPAAGSPLKNLVLPDRAENDLAIIIYTSGTTGRPKGAMLSNRNLLSNVESCRIILRAVGDDRFVVLLPMFHSFMLCVGIALPMLIGGSMVLIKSVNQPKSIVEEIIRRKATLLPAVPQFFRTFAHPSIPPNLPLRVAISGGAPLPGEILKEFTAKFPFPLLEGYGLSEASPVCTFNPFEKQKAGSIGKPIPNVEVSVQDESGRILPPDQTGEICIKGDNVMLGYWNQPEETKKSIRANWLLTGDVGHQDADGFLFITDRKKDMLLVNGINVYPREIEEIIYKVSGVKEAAVIGVPDSRKGEQPLAFVSAQDGFTLDEKVIQQFIRERLADYKVPKKIIVLPALPRNATGKILKKDLKVMAANMAQPATA